MEMKGFLELAWALLAGTLTEIDFRGESTGAFALSFTPVADWS